MEKLLQDWMDFSKKQFPNADELTSLKKLRAELIELEECIKNPESSRSQEVFEYVDLLMCLLHSANSRGFSSKEIIDNFKIKFEINKERKWLYNGDGTYSHVK